MQRNHGLGHYQTSNDPYRIMELARPPMHPLFHTPSKWSPRSRQVARSGYWWPGSSRLRGSCIARTSSHCMCIQVHKRKKFGVSHKMTYVFVNSLTSSLPIRVTISFILPGPQLAGSSNRSRLIWVCLFLRPRFVFGSRKPPPKKIPSKNENHVFSVEGSREKSQTTWSRNPEKDWG